MGSMEMEFDLDLSVLDDEPPREAAGPLEQWAEKAVYRPGGAVVLDIETGALPWEEIEQYWTAPPAPGPFDESTVKYGNLKDEAKRAAKLADAQAAHKVLVDGYSEAVQASKAEFTSRAALSATTGRVIAIGYLQPGLQVQPAILGSNIVADVTESAILRDFWQMFGQWLDAKTTIVGHNIFGFDLPFLIRRAWKYGLDVPSGIRQGGRWWNPLIRDTMVEWQMGPGMVKLDSLARYFKIGQKTEGVSGADFARLWAEDHKLAEEYLRNDVTMTAKVATCLNLI